MKILFMVVYALLSVLFAAFLELNKHTLLGWVLFAVCAVLFLYLHSKVPGKWMAKAGLWLGYIAALAVTALLSWPPVKPVPAVTNKNPDPSEVITIQTGKIQGVYNKDHSVEVYAGIPYAKPPVGELRWRKPQDPESWEGIRVCDTFAPMSMQEVSLPIMDTLTRLIGYHEFNVSLYDNYRKPVSEDSLYLNVWKPAGDVHDLPVLVYIHGGSLKTGQTWYKDYNGEGFARDGVITVNMNYRLGVFGFYADEDLLREDGTTGNYGLLDQIKALEWVRDNIEAFGGDPDNVTLAGESAGAVCVDALCVSPLAEGLFQRAILESSSISSPEPPHSFRLLEDALASGKDLRSRYGCSTADEMRALPAEQITGEMETQHHVTIDEYVLTDLPYNLRKQGSYNEAALLHGYNKEESGPFIMFDHADMKNYEEKVRRAFGDYADEILELYAPFTDAEADAYWAELYGATYFNYSHDCLNRLMEGKEPVYQYLFTKNNGALSSWHSGELIYAFGTIPETAPQYDSSDRELSRTMHAYWTNFIKTGNPNGEGLPEFETDADTLMEFGETTEIIENPYRGLFEIFDRIQGFRN